MKLLPALIFTALLITALALIALAVLVNLRTFRVLAAMPRSMDIAPVIPTPSASPSPTNSPTASSTPVPPSSTPIPPSPSVTLTFTPAPSFTWTALPSFSPLPSLDVSAEMRSIGCTCQRLPEGDPLEKDCNLASFDSTAQAQRCFAYCFGATGEDIYSLDHDGNGIACETGLSP